MAAGTVRQIMQEFDLSHGSATKVRHLAEQIPGEPPPEWWLSLTRLAQPHLPRTKGLSTYLWRASRRRRPPRRPTTVAGRLAVVENATEKLFRKLDVAARHVPAEALDHPLVRIRQQINERRACRQRTSVPGSVPAPRSGAVTQTEIMAEYNVSRGTAGKIRQLALTMPGDVCRGWWREVARRSIPGLTGSKQLPAYLTQTTPPTDDSAAERRIQGAEQTAAELLLQLDDLARTVAPHLVVPLFVRLRREIASRHERTVNGLMFTAFEGPQPATEARAA